MPAAIISHRDPKFIGQLWTAIFQRLDTKMLFSIAWHPQTDTVILYGSRSNDNDKVNDNNKVDSDNKADDDDNQVYSDNKVGQVESRR